MSTDIQELYRLFRENADAGKAVEMSAYMRDQFPFIGLAKPVRAGLQKEFLKAAKKASAVDWALVHECWAQEREFQYFALDYLAAVQPLLVAEDVPRLRELAVTRSWWDTVDALDAIIGKLAQRFPELKTLLLAWSTDENFWLRRIAIDHQLAYKDQTDTALLEQIITNNLGQKEFFINKAIGWSLREYSKINPEWVRSFLDCHREQLAPLSLREASKYL
jgi:3-methyladenine DNA glycosylase AlkD